MSFFGSHSKKDVDGSKLQSASSNWLTTDEYAKRKKEGLKYIRSISTITEQISEIEAELNAVKALTLSDPVRKAEKRDWIKTLNAEKKKILTAEKKQNKALKNLQNTFDMNIALKQELKALQNEYKQKTEKIKRIKTAQLVNYKKERDQAIKKLKENRAKLQNKIKEHELFKKKQEIKEQKKTYVYEVKLNI